MNTIREEYEELEKSYGEFLDHIFQIQRNHNDKMDILESSIIRFQIDTIGNSMKSIRNILDSYIIRKNGMYDKRRSIE